MIGDQEQGAIEGVVITAISHQGLTVSIDGKPGRLAVLTEDGHVIAEGDRVAREAEAVAVNAYREMLQGRGHMRVVGAPLPR
ncbi:hypothetical protein [Mitsuaria sp. GD03876]|uniref:hypothetical protein n=1 Tax=Mitsuaria sp. GD03876 TaxID=2975399 RepID=UPI0024498D3E|nr:hypothetical protein [Mitsuaria sp. GD03876]MDH0866480.1 hypothetical protein [Mitsuaria sp. GD03876]